MKKILALPILLVALCTIVALNSPSLLSVSWAQEEEEFEFDPDALEQRLDEIERAIDEAESEGDESRVRELRREGERLLDQLEEFERSQIEDEEGEVDWDEEFEMLELEKQRMEVHRTEIEIERMRIELGFAQQESALRLAKLANDRYAMKAYALSELIRHQDPEEAAELVADLLEENEDDALDGILRLHLARLYRESEQPDRARRELRRLILE